MKYVPTDQQGSFIARGIGLIYTYNADNHVMKLLRARQSDPVFATELNKSLAQEAFSYIAHIEKITKIKALRFSGNTTTNLAGTLENELLSGVLASSARLAHCAFNLQRHKFDDFCACFIKESGLQKLLIRRLDPLIGVQSGFFQAEAAAVRGPGITVKSSTVHGALQYLSERIVEDMVSREYAIQGNNLAGSLLSLSLRISTLSFVLNDRFDPAVRLGRKGGTHSQAIFQKAKNQYKTVGYKKTNES